LNDKLLISRQTSVDLHNLLFPSSPPHFTQALSPLLLRLCHFYFFSPSLEKTVFSYSVSCSASSHFTVHPIVRLSAATEREREREHHGATSHLVGLCLHFHPFIHSTYSLVIIHFFFLYFVVHHRLQSLSWALRHTSPLAHHLPIRFQPLSPDQILVL
jgi:hypothetical protein